MFEAPFAITSEERTYLLELLRTVLNDTKVEEHRTRTPSYRRHIEDREKMIAGLLQKLGGQPV